VIIISVYLLDLGHLNWSSQGLSLADMSGRPINAMGIQNLWVIGAMIAAAVVLKFYERFRERTT
jgi:hypothetical protein